MIRIKNISILLLLLYVLVFKTHTANAQFTDCTDGSMWELVSIIGTGGVCDDTPWVLAFEDNFDGSSLDFTKWGIPYQGMTRDYDHNHQKQWNANTGTTPSIPISNNIIVSNGTLKIITKKENPAIYGSLMNWSANPPVLQSDYYDYSSAEIHSVRKFGYGKYEIRCKIPKGKGFWPAFWTYSGPRWNEIDVFEFWNELDCFKNYDPDRLSKNPHFNNHYDYNNTGTALNCGDDLFGPCESWDGPDFSADFHTFTMIYDRYKIEWYIDGVLKSRVTQFRNILGQAVYCSSMPPNQNYFVNKTFPRAIDFSIIFNTAVKAEQDDIPDGSTIFPANYEIDYVRFYEQIPCTGQVTANTTTALDIHSTIHNAIVGTTINVGGTAIVANGNQLDLIARDAVKLNPGFSAGNDFVAKIDLSICSGVFGLAPADAGLPQKEIEYILVPSAEIIAGLDSISTDFDVKMYPNPTKDILNIVVREEMVGKYIVTISDLVGNILLNPIPLRNNETKIDLSNYSAGMYIIRIFNAESNKFYVNTIVRE